MIKIVKMLSPAKCLVFLVSLRGLIRSELAPGLDPWGVLLRCHAH